MKICKLLQFKTLSARLVALFLCALVPLQIFGISLFCSGYSTIADQIKSISASTITSVAERVGKEIQATMSDLYEIEANAKLRQITYPWNNLSSADYYTSLNDIKEYITILENNPWIQEIRIYITRTNMFLSVDHTHDTDLRSKYRHSPYDQASLDMLIENARSIGTNSLMWDEAGPYVAILYPQNSYVSEKKPNFAIQIRLNEDEIRSALSNGSIDDQEKTAMLDLQCGRIVTDKQGDLSSEAFVVFYDQIRNESFPYTGSFTYNNVDYFATACMLDKLGLLFMQMVPRSLALQSLHHYNLGLVGFVLISLIAFIFCAWLSIRTIHNPIQKLVNGFEEIEGGNYGVQLPLTKNTDELTYLVSGFNHMSAKLSDTINSLYKQEIYAQRMELNQLQLQINPHFLFNSYFMMDRLLQQGEHEVAAELSNCLGEYFRYINRDARRYVELSLEWNHMCSYAKVQQLRYCRRLELVIQPVPHAYKNYIVPRLILQPLVENAVEHGLAHTNEGGLAQLSFVHDAKYLRVIMDDNGREASDELIDELKERLDRRDESDREMSALINIHRRVQLYYGEEYGVCLSRSYLNGLHIEIVMPSIERRDLNANDERADRG